MQFGGFGGFVTSALIAGAILWSFATTDVELSRLVSAGPRIADFLGRMFPPDPTVMAEIRKGSAETLRIAILGSLGAVILSIPLAILASETMVSPAVFRPIRTLLAFIRAIPLILVAMLMVGAVGLGPLPGIIAVAFHATGMLAKFYAEAIDGVSRAPIAALESAGAGPLVRLRYAIWPQMAPVVAGHEQLACRQTDAQRDLGRHGVAVGAAANAVGAEITSLAHDPSVFAGKPGETSF